MGSSLHARLRHSPRRAQARSRLGHANPRGTRCWIGDVHMFPDIGCRGVTRPLFIIQVHVRMELDLIGAWFCQVRMKIPSFASHFDGTSSGLIISWTIRVLDGPRLCAVGLAGLRACIAILHARQCGDVALSFRVCSWLLSCSATSYAPC